MPEQIDRQVAIKVAISDIASGSYIKKEGWEPNIIIAPSGKEFSRANLIAIVIDKSDQNITVDDGTGNILVRSFENSEIFSDLIVGDTVLIVGRPREYESNKYISAEIVKKTDSKWLNVRKKELALNTPAEIKPVETVPVEQPAPVEEVVSETSETDKVYELIKKLDTGTGADYETIIKDSSAKDTEKIISSLLMEGEVFEISPGKLKVLE